MVGDLLALFWVFLDPLIEGRAPYLLLVPTDEFQTLILHCGLQMWFQSMPLRANIHSHHLMAADPIFQKRQCLPKTWDLKGVAFGLWSRLSASHYSNTQDAEWSGEKGRRQHLWFWVYFRHIWVDVNHSAGCGDPHLLEDTNALIRDQTLLLKLSSNYRIG